MRAVVDTNVLVSAVIRPSGRLGWVLSGFRTGAYTLVTSPALLDEVVEVLSRPRFARYGIDQEAIVNLRSLIEQDGLVVVPSERILACRDPKDDLVLEAAVAGGADVIATGDDDLLALGRFRGLPIVTPASFHALLERTWT